MLQEQITMSNLPEAMALIITKLDRLENSVERLSKMTEKKKTAPAHLPMNVDDACEFLRMKKPTLYQYLQKKIIPSTKTSKNYILFQDELIKWLESGRKASAPMSVEEMNDMLKRQSRKR